MLDVTTVRILAAAMAAATVVGIVSFSRRSHGRGAEFRAQDNPPEILQVVWPLLVMTPQLVPFVVAAVPDLAYKGIPHLAFPGDSIVQVVGLMVWALGGLLVMWAGRELGRFMMLQIAVTKDHELIQSGPYARIRHPTYAGTMGLSFGVALVFLNPFLLGLALAVVVVATYRARKEERLLASPQGLGGAYVAYMGRTGRFLPRLRVRG